MAEVNSAYGAWLAYVMDAKRIDTEKLAEKAGIQPTLIDRLIRGELSPENAREEVFKLGEILLSSKPREQMEKVLQALEIHVDLRNWAKSCDGGCCQWNIATEVSYDSALEVS
ncbi:hypothetical protein LRS74_30580 [Streptomyces sp. LX-29]|uniref:hypothetical protein n=1 Tax=Streptomyces sp. LX-29 TaxID=2900152 RepID=UPI00240DB8B2|nr:hypothetical protein [Streptomyces sp. LX-29]WFB10908.1 hypothetical protein LRS74_30580 [Streptomyces sp. LX-29]